jgi:hypothetical protein
MAACQWKVEEGREIGQEDQEGELRGRI